MTPSADSRALVEFPRHEHAAARRPDEVPGRRFNQRLLSSASYQQTFAQLDTATVARSQDTTMKKQITRRLFLPLALRPVAAQEPPWRRTWRTGGQYGDMRHHIYVMEGALARRRLRCQATNRQILAAMPVCSSWKGRRAPAACTRRRGVFAMSACRCARAWCGLAMMMDQDDAANLARSTTCEIMQGSPRSRASIEKQSASSNQVPGAPAPESARVVMPVRRARHRRGNAAGISPAPAPMPRYHVGRRSESRLYGSGHEGARRCDDRLQHADGDCPRTVADGRRARR